MRSSELNKVMYGLCPLCKKVFKSTACTHTVGDLEEVMLEKKIRQIVRDELKKRDK